MYCSVHYDFISQLGLGYLECKVDNVNKTVWWSVTKHLPPEVLGPKIYWTKYIINIRRHCYKGAMSITDSRRPLVSLKALNPLPAFIEPRRGDLSLSCARITHLYFWIELISTDTLCNTTTKLSSISDIIQYTLYYNVIIK